MLELIALGLVGVGGGEFLFGFTKRIDEIGDKIFVLGAFFESGFFVFDDNFVVGDFDDFATRNGELGVDEAFQCWAFNNYLLNGEIITVDSVIRDLAELATFLGLDFEADETEVKLEDFLNLDDVVGSNELVDRINNHTVIGVLANTGGIQKTGCGRNKRSGKV